MITAPPELLAALQRVPLPDASPLTAADALREATDKRLSFILGYAAESALRELIAAIDGAAGGYQISVQCRPARGAGAPPLPGAANLIAVASGKGGVGKSTTCVNLALALAAEGAKVGVLDADIYGPSLDQMLGVPGQRPEASGSNHIRPLTGIGGVQVISMGNLVTDKTPMVWRGPMASGALQQLLNNTDWNDLDYLLVDMPPGTGDIQLTLAQTVPITGAVIVTTPQNIALLDAQKGIEMFTKVSVPVLGVVENMAAYVCSQCGHADYIFGTGGGERLARDYGVELLGQLPLQSSIRELTDAGTPPVVHDPKGFAAINYRAIARRVGAKVWQQRLREAAAPSIEISDD